MKDLSNNEIKKGDFVAYAVRDGNSGVMRVGLVVEAPAEKSIQVIGASEWAGRWSLNSRKAPLGISSRIIVIPEASLHPFVVQLFRNWQEENQ